MNAALLGMNVLLFALWVWAMVDCARSLRNYWWLLVAVTAPAFLYAGALAYLANFKLLPALGRRPLDEEFAAKKRLAQLSAVAAERGLVADWLALAASHFEMGRWDECLRALRHALDREPDNLDAHLQAGTCLLRLGKTGPAVDHLDFVCTESPLFAKGDAATRLGEALAAQGDAAGAERWFRVVLERVPIAEPSVRLAELLLARGDAEGARVVLARASEAAAHWSPGEFRAQGHWPARLRQMARANGIGS